MNKEQGTALLSMAAIPGVNPLVIKASLEAAGSLERLLGATGWELSQRGGPSAVLALKMDKAQASGRFRTAQVFYHREWELCQDLGIRWVGLGDQDYPPHLIHCADPPPVLFVKGRLPADYSHALSVVGTRNISHYGSYVLRRFMEEWAECRREGDCKPLIVSGMALGVDGLAHELALELGFETLGVLANGLATVYPPRHRGLAARVLKDGALLSESPAYQGPEARLFPRRNRIIAGLSTVTLVVEAASRGGALITAQLASEYDRRVFAFPGRVTDQGYRGCLELILAKKAEMICSPQGFCQEMGWILGGPVADPPYTRPQRLYAAPSVKDRSATVTLPPTTMKESGPLLPGKELLPRAQVVLSDKADKMLEWMELHREYPAEALLHPFEGDYSGYVQALFELETQGLMRRTAAGGCVRVR